MDLAFETPTLITCPESGQQEVLARSFNFAEFPNLKEARFKAHRSLLWIHKALSTIKHNAPSRLSALQLELSRSLLCRGRNSREGLKSELRLISGEVARIERESVGAVDVTTDLPPWFKVGGLGFRLNPFLMDLSAFISFLFADP